MSDYWPDEIRHQKAIELREIFKTDVTLYYTGDLLEVASNSEMINLPILLQVCRILECEPEQLFWNADYSSSYYPGDSEHNLRFEIKRNG